MTVAFVSASAWFDGATGLTADKVLTLPSHSTGNLILVLAAWKTYTITAQITDSGWAEITEFADGAVASGNGSGSMKVGAWYKVAASGSETNPTLDFSSVTTLVGEACVLVFSQTAGAWTTPTFVTAAWPSSAGASVSASSALTTVADGAVAQLAAFSDDTTITRSPTSIDDASTTSWSVFATQQPTTNASTTTGNDMAASAAYRLISTGGAAQTLTNGGGGGGISLSTAETGAILWVHLADQAASVTVTPTTAALVATKFAPTVTATDHQLVTVPVAGGSTYPAAVLANSPVAYWRMGEASGSVLDSVGSAHGTTTGTVTRDATGLITADDGAISFAASAYVSGTLGAAIGNTFSLEMMVKLPASGTTTICPFSTKGSVSNVSVEVARSGSANNNFCVKGFVYDGASYDVAVRSNDLVVAAGGTYHIVWTRSGSTPATNKVYVNGADAGQTAVLTQAVVNTDTTFYIGGFEGTAETWVSTLDEVALYNTALSSGTVSTHYAAVSSAGGLALTTYAPTVTVAAAADPQLVTPTTATVVLTKFAPTVTFTDNQLVTPTTASLTATKFAPTVTATDLQLVTPTTKALTLATFAPTVSTPERATPSTVSLALTTFAPSISVTDNQAVTPTTKALTLVTFAPTVLTPERVTPATKTLALSTFAPTITNPDPQSVTPTTKSLTLATFAPSVGISDAASIVPPNASLSLTTYAPTVIQPNPQLVTPTTPALELHTFEPVVTATAHQAVTPTTAAVVTTRHIPTVAATANQSAIPTTKALTLTAYAPQVTVNNIVVTVTIGLTLTTFAPSVTAGTNTYAFPGFAELTLTGYAPFIDLSAFKLVTPATAVLVLTTYPPTAEQHSITPLPTPIYGFAVIATGPGAGVGSANGGATVQPSGRGSTTVRTSGPSAKVTIR